MNAPNTMMSTAVVTETEAIERMLLDAAARRIASERVCLTPLQRTNIYTHFRWDNDPELNRLDSEQPFLPESLGAFRKRFEEMMHPPYTACDLEMHTQEAGLIGVAFIDQVQPFNRRCRVGVTIGEVSRRGQGYGRETLLLLLDYLFSKAGMHRVMAEAFAFNTACQGLLEAVGFRREGCEREYLYRDGQYWDKLIYAMLDTEYRLGLHRDVPSGMLLLSP